MISFKGYTLDRYHILEQIGEGGMAVVYKAYDTRLESEVAIKVLRKDEFTPASLGKVLKRFEREAKALARLTHPNLVKVIDYGDYEGMPYLVMPYLPGGTLKQMMGKPMPIDEAVKLILPIANALGYAHQQGILHRDIKPSNILITENGEPMLSDFGIAKILEEDSSLTMTGTGVGIGTPEYMAPEQGLGRNVDARADIYSLGVVLYELVTGRKPYIADTPMAVIIKHISDPLPQPSEVFPDLPPEVDKLLIKALSKDPANRYQSMAELATAIQKMSSNISSLRTNKEVNYLPNLPPLFDTTIDEIDVPKRKARPIENSWTEHISQKYWRWLLAGLVILTLVIIIVSQSTIKLIQTANTATSIPSTFHLITTTSNNSIFIETPLPTNTPLSTRILITTNTPGPTSTPFVIATQVASKDGMMMIYIPEGEFKMGSNINTDNAKPEHDVYLDSYWVDMTEVTNGMYKKCVFDGKCLKPIENTSDRINYFTNELYDSFPVRNVDWNQAVSYCEWAGRELPTEAQWEKAARGPDGRIYPWGNQTNYQELANYNWSGFVDTTTVGVFKKGASPYGVLDMAGNVWEWVSDYYEGSYYSSQLEWNNPTGPEIGYGRILHGGSFNSGFRDLRSPSRRVVGFESYTSDDIGFRCSSLNNPLLTSITPNAENLILECQTQDQVNDAKPGFFDIEHGEVKIYPGILVFTMALHSFFPEPFPASINEVSSLSNSWGVAIDSDGNPETGITYRISGDLRSEETKGIDYEVKLENPKSLGDRFNYDNNIPFSARVIHWEGSVGDLVTFSQFNFNPELKSITIKTVFPQIITEQSKFYFYTLCVNQSCDYDANFDTAYNVKCSNGK